MKDIIKKLLEKWSCKHEWEFFKHIKVYDGFSNDMPCGHKYIFICKNVVKLKKLKYDLYYYSRNV